MYFVYKSPTHQSSFRNRLLGLCSDIDRLAAQLADLERRGLGNSPEAHQIRNQLKNALRDLGDFMRRVLTDRVVSFPLFYPFVIAH